MGFARIYQLLNNNTRIPSNCEHTPNELSEYVTKNVYMNDTGAKQEFYIKK